MEAQIAGAGVEVAGGVATGMAGYRWENAMRLLKLLLVMLVCAAGPTITRELEVLEALQRRRWWPW